MGFTILLIITFIVLLIFSYEELINSCIWTIIASILIAYFFYNDHIIKIKNYVLENKGDVIIILISYLFIGLLYSFLKFYLDVKKRKKIGFTKKELEERIIKPKITFWITFWPLSAVTNIGGIFTNIGNFIFNSFKGIYQKIINQVYK